MPETDVSAGLAKLLDAKLACSRLAGNSRHGVSLVGTSHPCKPLAYRPRTFKAATLSIVPHSGTN
jgi:hypothetical protein